MKVYNISFVIQGPIVSKSNPTEGVYSTYEVLNSIRKFYPDAEIVLSTWKGADVRNLPFDQLVLSDDPGGFVHNGVAVNNNRMILSTKAGILKASNSFVVKSRTDVLFIANSLSNLFKLVTPVKSRFKLFDRLILSSLYYVRNPLKLNLVFHPSDIFLAGDKEDLLSFFDVPLAPRSFYINDDETTRIVPEQYFMLHNIFKKKGIQYNIPGWGYINLKYFLDSERYLFNNFRFLDVKEFGIDFPKRLYSVFMPEANYTLEETRILSKGYRLNFISSYLTARARLNEYEAKYLTPKRKLYYQKLIDRVLNKASRMMKLNLAV